MYFSGGRRAFSTGFWYLKQCKEISIGISTGIVRTTQRISQLASGIIVDPDIRGKKNLFFSGGPTATSGDPRDGPIGEYGLLWC